jgi:hypothetical protein
MASITAKLLGVNKLGISMTITMNGDMGEHCLTIKASNKVYDWHYYLAMPDGRCFSLKCDEFLHEDFMETFDPENIFHVSAMMQKVMVLGHIIGTNAA